MKNLIAKTPPMGWNSWDCYGAAVTEEIVKANAEYMAENLKQYGWEYVVVDIQWSEPTANSHLYNAFAELEMDEYSRVIPAVNRFPSSANGKGFKPLGDYIHSLGLKFGIHIMRGIPRQAAHQNTAIKGTDITARQIAQFSSICYWNSDMYGIDCAKNGAQQYYDSIFELYAEWGVDFVKVDDICNHHPEAEIEAISKAIKNSGREMVLSISPGPARIEKAEHLKQYTNMWRITDDFWDRWNLLYDMFNRAEMWSTHAAPGHFPDADMLPLGYINQIYDKNNYTKFTRDEQITMMTLWCIMRSPLMIGGEMTKTDAFTLSLLNNEDLIEILNHSHSARQLYRKKVNGNEHCAWFATHENEGYYIALFNLSETESEVTAIIPFDGKFSMYDIWKKTRSPVTENAVSAFLPPHGAAVFKISKI